MSEFVFLYRGGEAGRSPERYQQTLQKWMAWFREMAAKGHVKNQGHPLERAGSIVKGSAKSVIDGPFVEAKDVIGGYSLIEAKDLEEAIELSKGCPILDAEGAVEVRPVMQLNI
ncbi:MAG TPA: YciI family protein [Pyrinomonadaceae bacterium]|nr:YciI family protein [Pyrinomonadaceae bacterium]